MLFKFLFKNKKEIKKKTIFDKYANLRKERAKNRWNYPSKNSFLQIKNKKILVYLFFLSLPIAIFAGVYFFPNFRISKFVYSSDFDKTTLNIEENLIGKNIFFLNEEDIIRKEKSKNIFLSDLKLVPFIPNTVYVEAKIDKPTYSTILINKYCLYNQTKILINCETIEQKLLTDDEYLIYTSEFSENLPLIKDYFDSKTISGNFEPKNKTWENLLKEEKLLVFNEYKENLYKIVEEHQLKIYSNLKLLYPHIIPIYLSSEDFAISEIADIVIFTANLQESLKISFENILWEKNFLKAKSNSKLFIFSIRDNISDIVTEYNAVNKLSIFSESSTFDFSGKGILVK